MITPKYKVLVDFGDGADKSYQYKVGDTYPRYGFNPTEERIETLLGANNAFGRSIIEQLPEEEPKTEELKEKKSKKSWN